MKPFQILGKRYLNGYSITGKNLIPYYTQHVEYRIPMEGTGVVNRILQGYGISNGDRVDQWHQDASGLASGLIVWSNIYPTEVLLPDDTIVAGEPYDVVLFDNALCKHRLPIEYMNDPSVERHFMRSFTSGYPTPIQIGTWALELRIANGR